MRRKPLVLISLLLAAFAINLDTTIVNVALPTLVRQLHASNSQLQWVVDAYNLVFAALLLTSGSLSDRPRPQRDAAGRPGRVRHRQCGRRADDRPGPVDRGEVGDGLGAAMIFPATLSLIANVFTERDRACRCDRAVGGHRRCGRGAGADRRWLAA